MHRYGIMHMHIYAVWIVCDVSIHLVHLQLKHINCLEMQTISQAVSELSLEANLIFAFTTN